MYFLLPPEMYSCAWKLLEPISSFFKAKIETKCPLLPRRRAVARPARVALRAGSDLWQGLCRALRDVQQHPRLPHASCLYGSQSYAHQKCLSPLPAVLWGAQLPPVENHPIRTIPFNISFRENVALDLLKACYVNTKGLGLTFQFRYWPPVVLQRCYKASLQVIPGPPRTPSRIASSLRPHPPLPQASY